MPNTILIKPTKIYTKTFQKKDGTQGEVYHIQLETPLFGQKYVSCWDADFVKNLKTGEEVEVEYTSSTSGKYTNITVTQLGSSEGSNKTKTIQKTETPSTGDTSELLEKIAELISTELDAFEKKMSNRMDTFEVSIDTAVKSAIEAANMPPVIEE